LSGNALTPRSSESSGLSLRAEGFWYEQPTHERVVVLKRAARLDFEDRVVEMGAGDSINIPASQNHRVAWTTPEEPTVWLAMFHDAG